MENDYNLPPGVSVRDINRAAGSEHEECERCGDSCEARELDEIGLCPGCSDAEQDSVNELADGLRAMSNTPDEENC